ncbi:hypothetical protein C1A50_4986 [Paenibacillus polymyxa]|nr:hypothetical protein C1A50_4986 [Paenibacillus polymyxa]
MIKINVCLTHLSLPSFIPVKQACSFIGNHPSLCLIATQE